ncbi:protein kinase [Nocardia sp. NPDC056000]|uniref:serine/threonine-protein kinase n=1 Tax=Nocardia sp. NPDC056000 TaxID=3345674 RepID=UPI0035D6F254
MVAGYRVLRLLGRGAMGSVYLAQHPRLSRVVALKILHPELCADDAARSAFDREAALASQLVHPNIVTVFDRSGQADAALWLSMRHIDGGDVKTILAAASAGLPLDQVADLATDIGHALDFAHHQGVLHRDVKPANILIEHDPRHGKRALLADFGIARTLDAPLTLTSIKATFAYAAPERFTQQPVDQRADIYSLGCTVFQLLTGRLPFPYPSPQQVISAHLTERPPRPSQVREQLPTALDDVLANALAKDPDERYQSCADLVDDLRKSLQHDPPHPAVVTVPSSEIFVLDDADNDLKPTKPWDIYERAGALETLGYLDRAEALYRRAYDKDHGLSGSRLVGLLRTQKRLDEAEALCHQMIGAGKSDARTLLADVLADRGQKAEAERIYRERAKKGDTAAMIRLAHLAERRGDRAESRLWRQKLDEARAARGRKTRYDRHKQSLWSKFRDNL